MTAEQVTSQLELLPDDPQNLEAIYPFISDSADNSPVKEVPMQAVVDQSSASLFETDHLTEEDIDESDWGDVGEEAPLEDVNIARIYIKEISQIPLLSHEEEIALSKRVMNGQAAEATLRDLRSQNKPIDAQQLLDLENIIFDGEAATEALVDGNYRLVVSIAKRYMGRGVPFLDLVQEGNIGLIRAAEMYDYNRGTVFSTYATWWIRQGVSRAVINQARIIRTPVNIYEEIGRLYRAYQAAEQEYGDTPDYAQIAAHSNGEFTPARVETLMLISRKPRYLDDERDDDDETVNSTERIPANVPDPEEEAGRQVLRSIIIDTLVNSRILKPQQVLVLLLRNGIDTEETIRLREQHRVYENFPSLQDVARILGVSRQRINKLEIEVKNILRYNQVLRGVWEDNFKDKPRRNGKR